MLKGSIRQLRGALTYTTRYWNEYRNLRCDLAQYRTCRYRYWISVPCSCQSLRTAANLSLRWFNPPPPVHQLNHSGLHKFLKVSVLTPCHYHQFPGSRSFWEGLVCEATSYNELLLAGAKAPKSYHFKHSFSLFTVSPGWNRFALRQWPDSFNWSF